MGVPAVALSAANAVARSNPLMPGMCTSLTTRSKRSPGGGRDAGCLERRGTGIGYVAVDPPSGEVPAEHDAVGGVVVDLEGLDAPQPARRARGLRVDSRTCPGERQRHPEAAAGAQPALEPALPAHEFDQLTGDGQAHPGATVPTAVRRVGLAEGLEDLGCDLRGDTDARVVDLESHCRRSLG